MPCPDSLLQQGKECWAPPSSVGCQPEGSARGYEQTGQAKKKKKKQPLKCQWLGEQEVQGQDCARFCLQVGRFCQNNVEHASWGKYFKINIKRISGRYAYYIIYISLSIAKKTWATWILIIINCIGLMPFGFDFGSAVSFSLSGLETKLICTRYVWELFNHDISQFKISGQNISWWSSGVCRLIVRALMSARTSSNFLRWSSVISTWSMSNSPALSGSAGMEGVEERQEVDFLSR